jgi:Cdc6-like AAA superfamily ATPase
VSHELVREAALGRAFDAEPLPDSLAACHVPFSRLVGRDAEGELRERLVRRGRVGVVGPVGSGKSSLVRYVVQDDRLAPVLVNVATEDAEKVGDPRAFLEVLISQIARTAQRAEALGEEERAALLRAGQATETLPGRDVKVGGAFGASAWMLSGRIAGDLTRTLPPGEVYATTDQLRDAAGAALRAIAAYDRVPVLVADDTDRLLRLTDEEQSRRLFEGFFGEVLRMIVDTLDAALVVAVHDRYRAEPEHGYDALTEGRIEHHLAIPELTEPVQLGRVITARAQFLHPAATADDLIDEDGLRELVTLHTGQHEHSLRRTLVVLKGAFSLASSDGGERATAAHVRAANAG